MTKHKAAILNLRSLVRSTDSARRHRRLDAPAMKARQACVRLVAQNRTATLGQATVPSVADLTLAGKVYQREIERCLGLERGTRPCSAPLIR